VFRSENATLTCDCHAVPAPAYTWRKDGTMLAAREKQLVITNAQKSKDDGSYVCVVTSGGQTATSLPHNLDVLSEWLLN
jgi:hypothetical protein